MLSNELQIIETPFNKTRKNNLYNNAKIIFMSLSGIAPIRFILAVIFASLSSLTLNLSLIGFNVRDNNNNFNNFGFIRRKLLYIPQILARITLFILGYYKIKENIPDKFIWKFNYLERKNSPKLIISNHISMIDTIYFFCRGIPSSVASANTLKLPIVGIAIEKLSPILVPTNNEQKNSLPNPSEQIKERLTHSSIDNFKRPLIIFPEGSTKNSKYLLKFQKGAFENKITYQPVLLNYIYDNYDPSWTSDSGTFKSLYLMCCQFINYLEVTYLEPCNLKKDEIRQIYINKLNLIDSNLSNHDTHILKNHFDKINYIYKYIFQNGKTGVEYYKNKYNYDKDSISKITQLFYELDINKNGKIDSKSFHKIVENTLNKSISIKIDKLYSFEEIINILNNLRN
jgi:1-acyl-sn-glycerol-3-phosphate acyltransferase